MLKHDVVVRVEDTLFVHGGISEKYSTYTPKELSSWVKDAIQNKSPKDILDEEGPLWYRGYLISDEDIACAELDKTLKNQNVSRMIVGHTTQRNGQIAVRCDGKLLGIDTGISAHYGSNLSAIEINGTKIKAIYQDKTVDINK